MDKSKPKSNKKPNFAKGPELQVLPPDRLPHQCGKLCDTQLSNPLIPDFLSLEQIGAWLKSEVQAFERDERALTLRMVRIGMVLVWVEKTQPRGTQATLLQLHFGNKCSRMLEKYIAAAKKVMRHLELLKGNTLTDAQALSEVVMIQPDLFDDRETLKHNAVLQKVSDFIGGRSLSKLLQEDSPLALGEPELKVPVTPQGHQKDAAANRPLKTEEQRKRELFEGRFIEFRTSFIGADWHHLYLHGNDRDEIGKIDLEKFLEKSLATVRDHNRAQALKERTANRTA